ncbi:MAG: ribosome small subunit-dependent GTPase A [Spirochaetia bacterium]
MSKGQILYGINNLFTIQTSTAIIESRIKGKHLKGIKDEYNVLTSGDWVELDQNNQIIARLDRKNIFARFNWKQCRPQAIATNLDALLCVVAVDSPPLHLRFLDRLLISAHAGNIAPSIVLTKTDLLEKAQPHPLQYYQDIGYHISCVNQNDPASIQAIKDQTIGRVVGLVGASGVGKSTLINALLDQERQKTGDVNRKFNKGNHTTNYAIVLPRTEGGSWVDTPGVRDLSPALQGPLDSYYPEFQQYMDGCEFQRCQHVDERACGIRNAVEKGQILYDRYANYCKLLDEETLKSQKICRYKR